MADACRIHFYCGSCESVFEIGTDDYEDSAWLMAFRFANAHVQCGFILPSANVELAVKQELGWEDLPSEEPNTLDEDAGLEAPGD